MVADLLAIVNYISDDNPDAAQWLKEVIEARAARRAEHPGLCRVARIEEARTRVVRANDIVVCMDDAFTDPAFAMAGLGGRG